MVTERVRASRQTVASKVRHLECTLLAGWRRRCWSQASSVLRERKKRICCCSECYTPAGLALCRFLADQNYRRISVEGEPGNGRTFCENSTGTREALKNQVYFPDRFPIFGYLPARHCPISTASNAGLRPNLCRGNFKLHRPHHRNPNLTFSLLLLILTPSGLTHTEPEMFFSKNTPQLSFLVH